MKSFLFFSLLLLLVLGAVVQSPVRVSAATSPIHYAVVTDLSRSDFNAETLTSAIEKFVSRNSKNEWASFFSSTTSPIIIDSQGSFLTAITLLSDAIVNASSTNLTLDAIFVADTPLITEGIVEFCSEPLHNLLNTPIISLLASGDELCDPSRNPQVICLCPVDNSVIRALLQTTYSQLGWEGVSVVLSDSIDGRRLVDVLSEEVALTGNPTITNILLLAVPDSNEEDVAFVHQMQSDSEVGVLCYLTAEEMERIHSTYLNIMETGAVGAMNLFFIGDYMALNALSSVTSFSTVSGVQTLSAALFVPHYNTASQLVAQGYLSSTVDELGAYTLTYLFDGLELVGRTKAMGSGTLTSSVLRTANFTGLSGQVSFESVDYNRIGIEIHLITAENPITSPLLTYTLSSASLTSIQNNQPSAVAANIPASPLKTATICLVSPGHCTDVSNIVSVMYVLMSESSKASLPYNINFALVNTGDNGVDGFSSLLQVSRQCTFLIGTGHSSVDNAIASIVNNYGITQIDFGAASATLTPPENAPIATFSRSIPEYVYSDKGFGEVCSHFGWERVIVVTTADSYGKERARHAVAAMVSRNIYVEKQYELADTSRSTILSTFQTIYNSDVSRIVFFALPLYGQDAENFYNIIDEATFLHNYVLLLDQQICMYGALYPSMRNKLQSSICLVPQVDVLSLEGLNIEVVEGLFTSSATTALSTSDFLEQSMNCAYTQVLPVNGFAVDAAYMALEALQSANAFGVSLYNTTNLLSFIRGKTFSGVTGTFSVDENGNRKTAAYLCNIQTPNNVVISFGSWSEDQKPNFLTISTTPWLWMDNSTTVPLDTFRDASFVFQSTALSSPGVIAMSIIGFVITVFAFFLCYRHYYIQRKIEEILAGNTIPITDTELKQLRGEV